METQEPEQNEVKAKASTTKQLAEAYDIPERTLRAWIKPIEHLIGPKNGQVSYA